MSGAATRNLVAASTTGQEYLTLKTLILKKPEIIIIIINACENFEVGKENYKTTGVRPSYSLPPHPLPSPTHQRLIYPIRKCFFPSSQNFTLPPKDGKKNIRLKWTR